MRYQSLRIKILVYSNFIFISHNIPINLERKVFYSCILPVLTYDFETTPLTRITINKLNIKVILSVYSEKNNISFSFLIEINGFEE